MSYYLLRFIYPTDDFASRFAALKAARPEWNFKNHGRIQEFSGDVSLPTGIYADDLGRPAWEVHPLVDQEQRLVHRIQRFVWYPDSHVDASELLNAYSEQILSSILEDNSYIIEAPSLSAYYVADHLEYHGRIIMY